MKNPIFREGFTKNQYIGGNCLKQAGGAWTACRFKGGVGLKKKRGIGTPIYTMLDSKGARFNRPSIDDRQTLSSAFNFSIQFKNARLLCKRRCTSSLRRGQHSLA